MTQFLASLFRRRDMLDRYPDTHLNAIESEVDVLDPGGEMLA